MPRGPRNGAVDPRVRTGHCRGPKRPLVHSFFLSLFGVFMRPPPPEKPNRSSNPMSGPGGARSIGGVSGSTFSTESSPNTSDGLGISLTRGPVETARGASRTRPERDRLLAPGGNGREGTSGGSSIGELGSRAGSAGLRAGGAFTAGEAAADAGGGLAVETGSAAAGLGASASRRALGRPSGCLGAVDRGFSFPLGGRAWGAGRRRSASLTPTGPRPRGWSSASSS